MKYWDWPQRTPNDKPRGIQSLDEWQLSEDDASIIADAQTSPARAAVESDNDERVATATTRRDQGRRGDVVEVEAARGWPNAEAVSTSYQRHADATCRLRNVTAEIAPPVRR